MKKCLFFMAIIILSIYFLIVPKGNMGLFDIKNAISSPDEDKVQLYVTSWCPYCKQAMAYLKARGIPFEAYDVERDPAAASRKKQLDDRGGVPFAVINGQKIHGFSEQLYQQALNTRGVSQGQEKPENLEKKQRQTGSKPRSWQVLNR